MIRQRYVFLSIEASVVVDLFDLRDYFVFFIRAIMIDLPDENLLTPQELNCLVECCMYNANGGSLDDFKGVWMHLKGRLHFIRRRNDLSTYKKKLGEKKWIKGSWGVFGLPKVLDILDNGDHFLVWENGQRKKVTELKINVKYAIQADNRAKH